MGKHSSTHYQSKHSVITTIFLSQHIPIPTPLVSFLPLGILHRFESAVLLQSLRITFGIINTCDDLVTFTTISARVFAFEEEEIGDGCDETYDDVYQDNAMSQRIPWCVYGSVL